MNVTTNHIHHHHYPAQKRTSWPLAFIAALAVCVGGIYAFAVTGAQADHGTCDIKQEVPNISAMSAVDAANVIRIYQRNASANAASGLANYTWEAGICSWSEMVTQAHVVGKALAIYALLSEPSNITVNPTAYPCAAATTGAKTTGYTSGFVDAGGLFIGWPTWDAIWDAGTQARCPLSARIADTKAAVEATYFNVTGVRISFDDFVIDYEPAWPDFLYVED